MEINTDKLDRYWTRQKGDGTNFRTVDFKPNCLSVQLEGRGAPDLEQDGHAESIFSNS